MNVLPRACARLLLLSLLCTTGLCQWSKSEWSCAGSVCHLPLGTVCACPGLQEHQSSCGEHLLCAFPAVLGPISCYPAAVLQPASTNQAKPPSLHGISLSHTLPRLTLFFPSLMPRSFLADNRCVLSRAKSCTECIRVDKDCSFCTDEVRPCRAAWGSPSHPADGGIPPPSVGEGHKSRGSFWIQLLIWMGSTEMWISFWCRKWGGRGVQGRIAAMPGFIRKCHCARNMVCKGWRESFIPHSPVTHWRSHFSCWFCARLIPISLPHSCSQRLIMLSAQDPASCPVYFPLSQWIWCCLWL